ncbi:hypothetical protein CEXT_637701 [Caerostris extrusa]|uniref:Uncharacterized protein n=1 Tax=Caerostris extrusa TaxID=172846 RepID=A0AAV4MGU7_CAEEX|nr:hypothetical protein CEXT_637701 [Caerostris extrusa]
MKCRIGSCPARSAVKWERKAFAKLSPPSERFKGLVKIDFRSGEGNHSLSCVYAFESKSGILAENGKSIFLLDLSPVHFLQVDIPFWSETVTKRYK